MVISRACKSTKDDGGPCRAAPLQDSDFCFWHDPAHAADLAEAQRLGGLRRRRENTVSVAYEIDGLETVEQIRRLILIAVLDTLGLENSVARSRTVAYLAQVATKLLEVGELQKRLAALEGLMAPRLQTKKAR